MNKLAKPRVLIFHPALAPYRLDLFNSLANSFDLKIIFLHENVPYQDFDQEDLLRRLDARFEHLTDGIAFLGRELRTGIADRIRQFSPELVISHEFSPVTFQVSSYCRRAKLPHVVWTADTREVIEKESRMRRVARHIALRRIDGLIVYSADTKALYQSTFEFAGPIGICPNVQQEKVLRQSLVDALPESAELVNRHGLLGKKVLLYVGRLATVKRVDRLINAFANLGSQREEAVLVLVGDGPERDELATLVADHEIGSKVIFTSHIEGQTLLAWYNIGSLFIISSEFEPWGAVVNEALLSGIPVICSDKVGARELVPRQGGGEIVDTSDPAIFKQSVEAWVDRVAPVTKTQLESIRNALIENVFENAVAGFVSTVERLLGDSGRL